MESIIRDVTALDKAHRRALEDVLGRELRADQRLVINVLDVERDSPEQASPQSLGDWTQVYEGLSDEEIEQIDRVANSRAI